MTGIAVLVAAGFFGYTLALLQRRVGSMISNQTDEPHSIMKPNIAPTPQYQRASLRPPLIPSENEPETQEGFIASLGKLAANATSSFLDILSNIFPGFKKKQPNYQYQNQQPFHPDYKHRSNTLPVQT